MTNNIDHVAARFCGRDIARADAAERAINALTLDLLRAGWPPEDVAAMYTIEGAAIGVHASGRADAARMLRYLAIDVESADG